MKNDENMRILATFISSIIQDFEIFLRTQIDLVHDDIRLVLDEYKSSFITNEIEPGVYTLYDFSPNCFKYYST